jgi:hypothetical protein
MGAEGVMEVRLYAAAIATIVFGLSAGLHGANAASVDLVGQSVSTSQSDATSSFVVAPFSSRGVFTESISGSIPDDRLSPFVNPSLDYSVISDVAGGGRKGDPFDIGSAVYNITPQDNVLSFLWGSPDAFNTVTFYTGPAGTHGNGTGTVIATFTGSDLSAILGEGYDLVTFDMTGVGSVVFSDDGQSAFEYADVDIDPTPLPAALPLFASSLILMGLFCRPKRRKGPPAFR